MAQIREIPSYHFRFCQASMLARLAVRRRTGVRCPSGISFGLSMNLVFMKLELESINKLTISILIETIYVSTSDHQLNVSSMIFISTKQLVQKRRSRDSAEAISAALGLGKPSYICRATITVSSSSWP